MILKQLCILTISITELQQGSVAAEQEGILRDAFMRCNDPARFGAPTPHDFVLSPKI